MRLKWVALISGVLVLAGLATASFLHSADDAPPSSTIELVRDTPVTVRSSPQLPELPQTSLVPQTGVALRLGGRVVDYEGRPLANVEVGLWTPELPHQARFEFVTAHTGEDGRFDFDPVPTHAVYSIELNDGNSWDRFSLTDLPGQERGQSSRDVGELPLVPGE